MELSNVNRRTEDLVKLQRKIAAYRQIQQDTTAQLYTVSTALLVPEERTLESTLVDLCNLIPHFRLIPAGDTPPEKRYPMWGELAGVNRIVGQRWPES